MTPSTTTKARTDSTDRTPALPPTATRQPKSSAARLSQTVRRLLNTLMRSLANPHV